MIQNQSCVNDGMTYRLEFGEVGMRNTKSMAEIDSANCSDVFHHAQLNLGCV
jgi:hypothetical protein